MVRLERLPVMIVIHTDGMLGPVVTGCQTRRMATISPGVGRVPGGVAREEEGSEGCRRRGLARVVMVGHLVCVAVIVTGVLCVEVRPLGGGGGRRQGLLALPSVNLTGGWSRSRRGRRWHQVVSHLPGLLNTGALLLLPPHHADDDADQEDDHHHREADHEDQDKGRLRCEGLGLCKKIFDEKLNSPLR